MEAKHPYQFLPYLDEGFAPRERLHRREVDHRMRLVRMAIPVNERVEGEPFGLVTMQLRFPKGRSAHTESLLSVGPPGAGDLFLIRYLSDTLVQFGMENVGNTVFFSKSVEVEPNREYRLQLLSGSLLPEGDSAWVAGMTPEQLRFARTAVSIRLDGREILKVSANPHRAQPGEVYAGIDQIDPGTAESQFSGTILNVARGSLPPVPAGFFTAGQGAMRLLFTGPLSGSKRPEPLMVAGEPGRAILGFIIPLPDGRAHFGVEIWGAERGRARPSVFPRGTMR